MPKLWTATIETHRSQVREAVMASAATLVGEHGLRAVTMSRIAEDSGIGRATLYKYFPDVESILVAWHEGQVDGHLERLAVLRDQAETPVAGLKAVLRAYAGMGYEIARQGHGTDLVALVHRPAHMDGPERRLRRFLAALIADCATSGAARTDVSPDELSAYCLNALAATGELTSRAAVERLVTVTLAGLGAGRE